MTGKKDGMGKTVKFTFQRVNYRVPVAALVRLKQADTLCPPTGQLNCVHVQTPATAFSRQGPNPEFSFPVAANRRVKVERKLS